MTDSVLGAIRDRVEKAPDAPSWTQMQADGSWAELTRGDLLRRAEGVAAGLEEVGVEAGQIVALLIPHSEALPAAWLGATLLGAVPTILAEPSVRMARALYADMLTHLFTYLEPKAALVLGSSAAGVVETTGSRCAILDVAILQQSGRTPRRRQVGGGRDVLALQHSSGTTGRHKGVLMTHEEVLAQLGAYTRAIRLDATADRVASWLPLYHDMGFIACFLMPLVYGVETVQISPFHWITRPWSLIRAVHARRATLSWLPNFAFHLLASRCTDEHLAGMDLTSWRQVINCSEPCTPKAFRRFVDRFAPYGFRPGALGVSYAMAETVFAVTEAGVRRPVVERTVARRPLHSEGRLVDADEGIELVGCGQAIEGATLEVRDEANRRLPVDAIGEIWVRAPYLMKGYYRHPDLTAKAMEDGWYRTGDLGSISMDGEVFVTGRKKDLLIVGGINIVPQDVEEIVAEVPGVIAGRAVAIGPFDPGLETQRLVVLCESDEAAEDARARLGLSVRSAVGTRMEVQVSDVRVYPRGVLRKSTSGKLSRAANLELYESGPTPAELWNPHSDERGNRET